MNSPMRLIVIAVVLAGCGGENLGPDSSPDGDAPLFAGFVSDPVGASAGGTTSAGSINASLAGSVPLAWISAPPGTIPNGTSVTIRNPDFGSETTALVADGGFDPVPIAAAPGDSLRIAVEKADGSTTHMKAKVPGRRRPRVVRTSPAKGRIDVAINASIVVIFSEPIADSSVSETRIKLSRSGTPVSGTVARVSGSAVGVEFRPAQPLAPDSEYQLVLDPGIVDLEGDVIEAEGTIGFTTSPTPPPGGPAGPPVLRIQSSGQFPAQLMVGLVSDPVTLTVTNVGGSSTQPLLTDIMTCPVPLIDFWWECWYWGAPEHADLRATENNCLGQVLPPAQSCTLRMVFGPSIVGTFEHRLYFALDADPRFVFYGEGTGLALVPSELGLGHLAVGSSAVGIITATNRGDLPTGAIAVRLTPGAFTLEEDADKCTGRSLSPNESCNVSVRYSPVEAGMHSATISLDASPGGPNGMAVYGSAE